MTEGIESNTDTNMPEGVEEQREREAIVVYWTSRDEEVARELVFPYVLNSKLRKWWEEVTLVIWGPSQKTLCENESLQEYIDSIREAGIKLEACKACSDNYGISDQLTAMGIEVKYMGLLTTQYIKAGKHILTF
jgi:hypothetical protein